MSADDIDINHCRHDRTDKPQASQWNSNWRFQFKSVDWLFSRYSLHFFPIQFFFYLNIFLSFALSSTDCSSHQRFSRCRRSEWLYKWILEHKQLFSTAEWTWGEWLKGNLMRTWKRMSFSIDFLWFWCAATATDFKGLYCLKTYGQIQADCVAGCNLKNHIWIDKAYFNFNSMSNEYCKFSLRLWNQNDRELILI